MQPSERRPNILLFIPHDLGDHLRCYGHASVRSPNLDRLASRGVRFTDYFTAAPECTPSRAGMFTGLYTHQNGLMGLTHRGWELNPDAEHLAKRLWRGGYQTYLFGWQHEAGGAASELGYNHLLSQRNCRAAAVCDEAAAFVQSPAACGAKPWFACLGFIEVHRPWSEETPFSPEAVEVPAYLPDNPATRTDLARFHHSIEQMDTAVGRVLDALEKSPAAQDTIVIFTTDHGIPFPRAKSTFYDAGIRLPFIIRRPGRIDGGRTVGQLLSNLDLCPTLLEAAGLPVPDGLEGRSFWPLLGGRLYKEREEVCGALFYDSCYDPMHMVRTRRYKYIRSFAVTPEDARGADAATLARHKRGLWIRADDSDVQSSLTWQSIEPGGPFPMPPAEELYDLENDPLEQNNRADDPALAPVLGDLRARLRAMMERSHSPLLHGHVSPDLSRTRNMHWSAFMAQQGRNKKA
jgi:arylsulfatase A-like enzyme